jgi:alpha-2-macroglobulin
VNGLAYGTDYKVTLANGLRSKSGDRTKNAETVDVNLGDKPSRVSISGDGYILPRNTSNGLAIQTVNVDHLKIRVLRMSDRLVSSSTDVFRNNADNDSYIHTIENGGLRPYQLRELVKQEASLIWSGTMDIVHDHNRTVQTAFPLAGIIKSEQPGAYLVMVEDAANAMPDKEFSTVAASDEQNDFWRDRYQMIPAHWVMVTDIALTAMTGADGLHVSARSLKSAEPLVGVKVTLLATGQDQLGQATTDANGWATFGPGLLRGHGASAAATITAYGAQGDFAILDLNRAAFDLSDRGVSGRPSPGPSEAFVYTERGVYRPGETVEVMALLRDRIGDGLINTPLTLVLRRPDGVAAKTLLARSGIGGRISSVDTLKQDCRIRAMECRGVGRPGGRADWPCPIQRPGLRAPDAEGNTQALGDSPGTQ